MFFNNTNIWYFCTPSKQHTQPSKHTHVTLTTPCSVRYPCLRPVCPPGTTPRAGGPPPSLLSDFYGNPLHRPPGFPPLVTLATQVTALAHKAGATDAAALDVTALRHRAVGAAATGNTILPLSIPPAVGLDQSQRRGVEGDQWEWVSRTHKKNKLKVQVKK